jgi:aldose 1-epimerase
MPSLPGSQVRRASLRKGQIESMAATPPMPSGAQYRIAHGDHVATIAEVGAAVRDYRVAGRAVFENCPVDQFSLAYDGAVLLPWPNRLDAGRYDFDGTSYQVPVTEPERQTALHGLSPYRPWTLVEQQASRAVLSLALLPSPGYPFFLDTTVVYVVNDHGLRVTTTSTNVGDHALPYGVGFHPWLSAGGALLDECTLTLDAGRRFLTDDRLLPVGEEDVAGTPFDFRTDAPLGDLSLDDAFTDVRRRSDELSWVGLTAPDGRTATVWMDGSCTFWQLCSGDSLPPDQARRSLAAEPMTAAPNAFNSGRGLIRLEPGQSYSTTWGATLL